jgi:hypothetical protein
MMRRGALKIQIMFGGFRPTSTNKTNWDDHLPTVLFSYKTTYKVAIRYIHHTSLFMGYIFSCIHNTFY